MEMNEQTLRRVASKVFETMAFTIIQPPKNVNQNYDSVVFAQIQYKGPFCGKVTMTLPLDILPELTRNMLGEEEECQPSHAEQMDVLGELLNVISGNVLNAIAGPKPVFHLQISQVKMISEIKECQEPSDNQKTTRLWFPQGWAELTVSIDGKDAGMEPGNSIDSSG